jgi:ER-bound oxygenase mpaB/B'/Rubber oxygenase, catalytic domain
MAIHPRVQAALDRGLRVPTRVRSPFDPEPWAQSAERLAPMLERDDRRIEALAAAHLESDPLADDVVSWMRSAGPDARALFERAVEHGIETVPDAPEALRALLADVEQVPTWFERGRALRAGGVHDRVAGPGAYSLFAVSLLGGYVSSGIAKTLVATGALERMAVRRLVETGKFVEDIYAYPALDRFDPSIKSTLRVRIMHAMVRRTLLDRGFDVERYGVPINQADMVATVLAFSVAFLLGLQLLGFRFSDEELDDFTHLWRRIGGVMGVRDALLPKTFQEAREQFRIFLASQTGPDQDSRALADALLGATPGLFPDDPASQRTARHIRAFMAGFCRAFVGDLAADGLGLPRELWQLAPNAMRPFVGALESARLHLPFLDGFIQRTGRRLSSERIADLLAGDLPSFVPHDLAPRA